MPDLFSPLKLGALELPNRILMAPLTRGRATPDGVPTDRMRRYYAQRADGGLIISEATAISAQGYGWAQAPGDWTDAHEAGWRSVTGAVHAAGGRIFLQLWHMGRVSHPDFQNGNPPVAPSAVRAEGEAHTLSGKKPYVTPRALEKHELPGVVADYVAGAKRAVRAGFDGVEIHSANGYLLDQFLRDHSNRRSDEYGGSIENRMRFPLEVVRAVSEAVGPERTGIRISPANPHNDMGDSDPMTLFTEYAKALAPFGLAYLHVLEALPGHVLHVEQPPVAPSIRKAWPSALILNGGYTLESGNAAVVEGRADAIAFGTSFLANPDLVERFRRGAPLNIPVQDTFYAGDERGYIDYPTLDES